MHVGFSRNSPRSRGVHTSGIHRVTTGLKHRITVLNSLRKPGVHMSAFGRNGIFLGVKSGFLLSTGLNGNRNSGRGINVSCGNLPTSIIPNSVLLLSSNHIRLGMLRIRNVGIFARIAINNPLSGGGNVGGLNNNLSTRTLARGSGTSVGATTLVNMSCLTISFPHYNRSLGCTHQLTHSTKYSTGVITGIRHTRTIYDRSTVSSVVLTSSIMVITHNSLNIRVNSPRLINVRGTLVHHTHRLGQTMVATARVVRSVVAGPVPAHTRIVSMTGTILSNASTIVLSTRATTKRCPSRAITTVTHIYLNTRGVPDVGISGRHLSIRFSGIRRTVTVSTVCTTGRLGNIATVVAVARSNHATLVASHVDSNLPVFTVSHRRHALGLATLCHNIAPIRFSDTGSNMTTTDRTIGLLHSGNCLVSNSLIVIARNSIVDAINSAGAAHVLAMRWMHYQVQQGHRVQPAIR